MWVKVCGVRDEQMAESICNLRPDAIGLNFYSHSPRSISKAVAARIARNLRCDVLRVGVFVNHSASEIEDLVGECALDWIQLHGDETVTQMVEIHRRLPAIPMLRAWRMSGEYLSDLNEHLRACAAQNLELQGCLIDSRIAGAYGGTGHAVPWDALATAYQYPIWPPLILAGGLTPDNVADAIRMTHPWGVDVASGVESAPGVKDLELVRKFIEAARSA